MPSVIKYQISSIFAFWSGQMLSQIDFIDVIAELIHIHCSQSHSGNQVDPHKEQGAVYNSIWCSVPEKPSLQMKWLLPTSPREEFVLLFLHGSSNGSVVQFCSHLLCLTLMALLFHTSVIPRIMNIKHRGEAPELGQENIIINLEKYGDRLGRIKEWEERKWRR